ncbi:MAG: hypothetical protein K9L95_03845 [Candidatus Omnitrophica bacterium]|nr:hypothetical protein [Candidatus Omnitrophota bacterium]MCF7878584.1 hypothetical protein [Candidatus Omnitrophota bacterium]MCF7892858.1 hypothetical protein [Candidatus Omnitrophota bacterium]
MKKIIVFAFISFIAIASFAETIQLKSGKIIEGKIVEETDKYIKVDSGVGVAITCYIDEIEKINGSEIKTTDINAKDFSQTTINTSMKKSQFTEKINKNKYKEISPSSLSPIFRWNFSKDGLTHTYDYKQKVYSKTNANSHFSGRSNYTEQKMSAKGILLIKSQGDNTAKLVLKKMQTKMELDTGQNKPKVIEQIMPPVVITGVKEDGSGSFGNSSQDTLLKMLFPLPPKSLKVGESADVPAKMPFNAMGSLLQAEGYSRITLARYVKIGKRICAQFDVDINISNLKVPSDLEGEYECFTKGTSVFYFDVEKRCFVSGTMAFMMQFSIDAPMPRIKISGENVPDNMPKRTKMSMINDNFVQVELKE